jgi:hypothetical protein
MHRAAAHAFKLARIGKFAHVATDGLRGHAKLLGWVLYQHLGLASRKIKDLTLPDTVRNSPPRLLRIQRCFARAKDKTNIFEHKL